ncbi:MAG: DUF924 family protein [Kofleriaceae bacterium]
MAVATVGMVLELWFGERARTLWFERDAAFDEELRVQLGDSVAAAERGELDAWAETPDGCLALVILLDQVTRNLRRGSADAFASDARSLALADAAIARGFDRRVPLDRRLFYYLPFEHAEDLAAQQRSVALFEAWADDHHDGGEAEADAKDQLRYVRRHLEIIARFGRFPHRNALLGRASTPEEVAFLLEPMSSF